MFKKNLKKILLFGLISLVFSLIASDLSAAQPQKGAHPAYLSAGVQPKRKSYFKVGEQIIYDVKLGKVTIGRAKFNHVAQTKLDGKPVMYITFETRLANFKDLEKIYSDAATDLPLKVERSIATWPSPEKITEDYDQKNFSLTIRKLKGAKLDVFKIKRDGPIQNAILLPFSVRNAANISVGWSMPVNLPTQQFLIKLVSIDNIRIPSGKFSAYHFESVPKKLEIWISADERRIPLKITGTGNLGYTLILKSYSIK